MKKVLFIFILLFLSGCSLNPEYEYVCESGYFKYDNYCIKIADRKDAKIRYSCTSGYFLENNKCVNTVYDTVLIKQYCPTGYTKNGSLCYKTRTEAVRIQKYYCPSGYTLSGTSCTMKKYYNAVSRTSCKLGGSYSSFYNMCFLYNQLSCPYGYSLYKRVSNYNVTCIGKPEVTYSCPVGFTRSGYSCIWEDRIAASYIRGCDRGEISTSGTYCIITDYTMPLYSYYCNSGYTYKNGRCEKLIEGVVETKYYCEGDYTLSGSSCYKYNYSLLKRQLKKKKY